MPEGPPLRKWELEGFRSIRDRVSIDLGQMNVLVGANSAGKSSLIQSILLAAQTLGTAWSPRPLVLNGSLVQLGLPEDCVNERTRGEFSFGFAYCTPDQPDLSLALPQARGMVEASISFAVKGASFDLARCEVTTEPHLEDESVDPSPQTLTFERGTKTAMKDRMRRYGLKGRRLDGLLSTEMVPVEVSEELPFVAAARFRQFLPYSLFETENLNTNALLTLVSTADQFATEGRARSGNIARLGAGGRFGAQRPPRFRYRVDRIPQSVVKFVSAYLRNEGIRFSLQRGSDYSLATILDALPQEALGALSRLLESEWFDNHVETLQQDMTLAPASGAEPFDSLVLSARRFFSGYVRHLGPIRIEPKPLYGLSDAASGDSVGSSGEYTAALLDAYGGRSVECPLLDSREVIRTTLSEAVDYWLKALGLLSSVAVQERGKLGYEVNLRIEGVRKTLDLTAVGVGVSQALPVIVQGLVAPPGSLVMFEQPELHLHPDVQAAIADFCLALAGSGRQVILETHSEFVVNRIRRRAAEDHGGAVLDLVRLHFVEREDGATAIRPVTVTSFGGLRDWPAGFMDQSAREAEAIMEAVQRRAALDDQGAG